MPGYGNTVFMRLLAQRAAQQQAEQEQELDSSRRVQDIVAKEHGRRLKVADTAGQVAGMGGPVADYQDPQLEEAARMASEMVRLKREQSVADARAKSEAELAQERQRGVNQRSVEAQRGVNRLNVEVAGINAGKYDKALKWAELKLKNARFRSDDQRNRVAILREKINYLRQLTNTYGTKESEKDLMGLEASSGIGMPDPTSDMGKKILALQQEIDNDILDVASEDEAGVDYRGGVAPPRRRAPPGGASRSVSGSTSETTRSTGPGVPGTPIQSMTLKTPQEKEDEALARRLLGE